MLYYILLTNLAKKYLVTHLILVSFVPMNFFKNLYIKSKKSIRFSATDPSSFVEIWGFTSTRIRVISLFVVLILTFSLSVLYFFGGSFSNLKGKEDVSIERDQLLKLREMVSKLSDKIDTQDKYIAAVDLVITGEYPVNTDLDSLAEVVEVDFSKIDSEPSKYEKELSQKVKDDMRTTVDKGAVVPYFKSPVSGVVSQKFNKKNHPGIDVVTEKDHAVKACLSGTVIYSGYTRMDGYILIIDHGNEYMSVYKHNKKALKQMGDKIQLGDPIAIVGNTGENTDGPHLHFELWYNQTPVNPEDYLNFTR